MYIMKISFYLLWSLLPFSKPNIENLHIPSCKNCIHFAPSYMNDFTCSLNKCNKFGTKDIITDEITRRRVEEMKINAATKENFSFKKKTSISRYLYMN